MRSRIWMSLVLLLLASHAWADEGPRISGFVDASYVYSPDRGEDSFGLDQVEVDVEQSFGERGGVRADLEWVKDGDEWVLEAEQGYLSWVPPFRECLEFTLGKFNAPIGFELLDAPDMYQFSHALVFDYGLPTNLTGAMLAAHPHEAVDARIYVVNGWDDNHLDGAGPKTVGARVGFTHAELGGVGLSFLSGQETVNSGLDPADPDYLAPYELKRTVIDLDVTATPMEALLLGGELNLGKAEIGDAEFDWSGLLFMAHYDVNEWLGFTGRFDWFDDPDDYVFDSGLMETRTAFVFAPTFVLAENMTALVELRIDTSSEDVFVDKDGEVQGTNKTLAFEMTTTW